MRHTLSVQEVNRQLATVELANDNYNNDVIHISHNYINNNLIVIKIELNWQDNILLLTTKKGFE